MPRSIKILATTAALLLVVGVAPAYADDDTTSTTEAPDTEVVEGDEESEGSYLNGKMLVLFGKGFDFSKGSGLGASIDGYLETFAEESDGDFDWGAYSAWLEGSDFFDELSEEQRALVVTFAETPPKNFGQLVSALRKHHGRNENSPVYAAAEDGETDGETKKGKKPDHAGTKGDNDGDEGDEGGGDEFSGEDKSSDRPGKGKKPSHAGKGGKKNNG